MHHFEPLAALAEVAAVKSHFRSVLWLLRQRRPPHLDPAQKVARRLLLDELEAYAERGVFPKNRNFPGERRPTFIDEDGTRCAVAHLLELSGGSALAFGVRDRMNFAAVSEIAEDPRFVAWLEAAGFTREEIALVQPSYCEVERNECVCNATYAQSPSANVALVSYRIEGRSAKIAEVHSALEGISVGQEVIESFQSEAVDGSERLAWVRPPEPGSGSAATTVATSASFTVTDGRTDTCTMWSSRSLPLAKAEAIKALLSPSPQACRAYLLTLDDAWDDTPDDCAGGGLGACDMSALAGSSSASLALLAALVGAIAARRRR